MLKASPKRPEWPINISWAANKLIRSFAVSDTIANCAVTIVVAEDSAVDDPAAASMLSGSAVVNSQIVTLSNGQTCPIGTVVTQKLINGVAGAKYELTFSPTYTNAGVGEGEQVVFDCVEDLPPKF